MRSCRTTRRRPAPRVVRTASSRSRVVPRARRRLARFAQAQDEPHHREHDREGPVHVAHDRFVEGHHHRAVPVRVGVRIAGRELPGQGRQLGLRLGRVGTGGQSAEGFQVAVPPCGHSVGEHVRLHQRLRNPDVRLRGRVSQAGRGDADHRVRLPAEGERPADDVRVRPENRAPAGLADDRAPEREAVVVLPVEPSELRLDAESLEEVRCHVGHLDLEGIAPVRESGRRRTRPSTPPSGSAPANLRGPGMRPVPAARRSARSIHRGARARRVTGMGEAGARRRSPR